MSDKALILKALYTIKIKILKKYTKYTEGYDFCKN